MDWPVIERTAVGTVLPSTSVVRYDLLRRMMMLLARTKLLLGMSATFKS
jgi:hypothetical protein